MLGTFQYWKLHLDSAFNVHSFERMIPGFRSTPLYVPISEHLLFGPKAIALMKTGQDKSLRKPQTRAWIDPGSCCQPPLPPSPRRFKGQLSSCSADSPSALAVAARFWNCLQLLLYFYTFSNYTLPFEYSICFKYLENANFFIYTCLKKFRLCCVPWVIQ